jgi:hypothetical protein
MLTLKTVLLGTSAVGALAIGGVTYATVSAPSASDVKSDAAQAVPAKPAPAAPAPVPAAPKTKCVPNVPDAGKAVPEAGKAVPNAAGQARDTVQQQAERAGKTVEQKVNEAQGAPNVQPRTLPAPGVPGTDCVPKDLPKEVKPNLPAQPEVPALPKLGAACDKMQPAIPVGTPLERSVVLSRGLGHATKHVGTVTYKAHKLCSVTQKWTGVAGQWLQIERVQTPTQAPQASIQQLRQALELPLVGGTPASISGQQGWVSPLGGSVLWYGGDGFALYVTGSPTMAPQLQDVAGKLQQLRS